jgi:hypothetical protein
MTHDEFRTLVDRMRVAQRRWCRDLLHEDFEESRALERLVDKALADFAQLLTLFDRGPAPPPRDHMIAIVDDETA